MARVTVITDAGLTTAQAIEILKIRSRLFVLHQGLDCNFSISDFTTGVKITDGAQKKSVIKSAEFKLIEMRGYNWEKNQVLNRIENYHLSNNGKIHSLDFIKGFIAVQSVISECDSLEYRQGIKNALTSYFKHD